VVTARDRRRVVKGGEALLRWQNGGERGPAWESNAAENERAVARFAQWLKKHEARLEKQARAEKQLIEHARKEMSVATARRP
jgi:hypothetical protein